jgi:tetratricopeptide (TPR) repeat protein
MPKGKQEAVASVLGLFLLGSAMSAGYALYKTARKRREKKGSTQLQVEADVLYESGEYQMAATKYIEAEQVAKSEEGQGAENVASICGNIARAYARQQKYTEALEYIEKGLAASPGNAECFKQWAEIEAMGKGIGGSDGLAVISACTLLLQREGKKKEADEFQRLFEKRTGDLVEEKISLVEGDERSTAVSLIALEEILFVAKELVRKEEFYPVDVEVCELIDRLELSALLEKLEERKAGVRSSKTSNFLLGHICCMQDKQREALEFLGRINNKYAAAMRMEIRAMCFPAENDDGDMRMVLESRDDPYVKMHLAEIELLRQNLGKYHTLIKEIERAGIALSVQLKAKMEVMMGEVSEAVGTLEEGAKQFPEDVEILSFGMEISIKLLKEAKPGEKEYENRKKRIEGFCRRVLGHRFLKKSPRLNYLLFLGYSALGDNATAVKHLQKAADLDVHNGPLHLHTATELLLTGDPHGFKYLEKAERLFSREDDLRLVFKTRLCYEALYALHRNHQEIAQLANTEAAPTSP